MIDLVIMFLGGVLFGSGLTAVGFYFFVRVIQEYLSESASPKEPT